MSQIRPKKKAESVRVSRTLFIVQPVGGTLIPFVALEPMRNTASDSAGVM